ncbi:hypothetical protein [Caudoviricetes sp.]|nr:hypothetical protein [Caudoviricetes sp.]
MRHVFRPVTRPIPHDRALRTGEARDEKAHFLSEK